MTKRLLRFAALAGLAACVSSPTQSIDFRSPPGWVASSGNLFSQEWHTRDEKENLGLVRLPFKNPSDEMKAHYTHLDSRARITICGSQSAVLFTSHGVRKQTGEHFKTEMLTTSYPGATYVVMYTRRFGMPADPAAERALRSVCLKK